MNICKGAGQQSLFGVRTYCANQHRPGAGIDPRIDGIDFAAVPAPSAIDHKRNRTSDTYARRVFFGYRKINFQPVEPLQRSEAGGGSYKRSLAYKAETDDSVERSPDLQFRELSLDDGHLRSEDTQLA